MLYFPIFLDLKGKECLVVGGGPVALRKSRQLLCSRARVVVVSPSFIPEFGFYKNLQLYKKEYQPYFCQNKKVVIAATDQEKLNEKIARNARKVDALVNVVDHQEMCDFIMPAVVSRGQLQIAISSGGQSPALAARLRRELEQSLPEETERQLAEAGEIRALIKEGVRDPELRRKILIKLGDLIKIREE